MKASSAISATASAAARNTGRPSAANPLSPTTGEFALAGPSDLPDPGFHAYRRDLADVALAGRVIASHYAEPVERVIARAAVLRSGPSDEADAIRDLSPGETFRMLDDTVGWAWGYAGTEGRVGYVRSEAVLTT